MQGSQGFSAMFGNHNAETGKDTGEDSAAQRSRLLSYPCHFICTYTGPCHCVMRLQHLIFIGAKFNVMLQKFRKMSACQSGMLLDGADHWQVVLHALIYTTSMIAPALLSFEQYVGIFIC